MEFDAEYPGTAVQRLHSVHARVKSLTPAQLNGEWSTVRRKLLWAGMETTLSFKQELHDSGSFGKQLMIPSFFQFFCAFLEVKLLGKDSLTAIMI